MKDLLSPMTQKEMCRIHTNQHGNIVVEGIRNYAARSKRQLGSYQHPPRQTHGRGGCCLPSQRHENRVSPSRQSSPAAHKTLGSRVPHCYLQYGTIFKIILEVNDILGNEWTGIGMTRYGQQPECKRCGQSDDGIIDCIPHVLQTYGIPVVSPEG